MAQVDFSIPAWKRAARGATTATGNGYQSRGRHSRARGFGQKCRRCREYMLLGYEDHRGLCNLCRAELIDSTDPDDKARHGLTPDNRLIRR